MSPGIRDLLVRGVAAAKANEVKEARRYLEWALRLHPSIEQRVEALFWLSQISADISEKRHLLEEVLAYQPHHHRARRDLAVLNGRLDEDKIVDPDHIPTETGIDEDLTRLERFDCPQCGGRLVFTPDGNSLICEHCASQKNKMQADPEATIALRDFTATLATAQGHTYPVSTPSIECKSCGAVFLQTPASLSHNCPYCSAVYVANIDSACQLIPPAGIIPFKIDQRAAREYAQDWLLRQKINSSGLQRFSGIYQPVWVFSISGKVIWTYFERGRHDWTLQSDHKLIVADNLLVAGSQSLPGDWFSTQNRFNLADLVPFSLEYLANWPAEIYQLSLSDASLQSRWKLLENLRGEIMQNQHAPIKDLHINAGNLIVETFKWVLVPVWLSSFIEKQRKYPLFINGQTGEATGELPSEKRAGWFRSLFPR
jgi:Zn finger protein HypA/HybF involved in hydrogenase expression